MKDGVRREKRGTVHRVNMDELLKRVEQDRALLNDLLSIFLDEFPAKLQELRDAVEERKLPRVIVTSHGLKGMLANLSIARAASCAAAVEQMARDGQSASLEDGIRALEKEVEGLLPEVRAHLAEVGR
jgi:two-component system, sensor histidine kinase and response regulator